MYAYYAYLYMETIVLINTILNKNYNKYYTMLKIPFIRLDLNFTYT